MTIYLRRGDIVAGKDELHMIKANIENMVGQRVRVTANRGRKRTSIREGFLEEAYPNVFVVKLKNDFNSSRKVAFNYIDVLTKAVVLQTCDNIDSSDYNDNTNGTGESWGHLA